MSTTTSYKLAIAERNRNIIMDALAGVSFGEMVTKYNLGRGYLQKVASEYTRKDRLKVEERHKAAVTRLYADRDIAILQAFTGMGEKVTAKHDKPQSERKRGIAA